jgi:hypothetical protein
MLRGPYLLDKRKTLVWRGMPLLVRPRNRTQTSPVEKSIFGIENIGNVNITCQSYDLIFLIRNNLFLQNKGSSKHPNFVSFMAAHSSRKSLFGQWDSRYDCSFTLHFWWEIFWLRKDRVTAQVVGRRPLTTEVRVDARGICDGQSGTGAGFSPSSSVFPCQYNSTVALHSHVSPLGWTIGPFVDVVQKRSLTPWTWTTSFGCVLLCVPETIIFLKRFLRQLSNSLKEYNFEQPADITESKWQQCWKDFSKNYFQ